MDEVEKVISDRDEEPEQEEPHRLQDLLRLGTSLTLAAGAEQKDRDSNDQRNAFCDVYDLFPGIQIDNEVAEDASKHFRKSN